MRRYLSLALCLILVVALSGLAWAAPSKTTVARDYSGYNFTDSRNSEGVLHGGANSLSKAVGDTFFLYGGPAAEPGNVGYNGQGKFQTTTLQPDRQGWTGVDLTEVLPHWNVSTFNAQNLDGNFTPNHAMWDGVPAGTSGFTTAPGYGNNFYDQLDKRITVNSTAVATALTWSFIFNYDSEPGYDFTICEWDSAGSMLELASFSGDSRDTNGVFSTPASFSSPVNYPVGSYVGASNNQVHLRILFDSDGAWSDEDGLWPTDGACQIDNISVSGTNIPAQTLADFEGAPKSNGGWTPVPADFAGEFSKVFPRVEDIDPCRDNNTPQMTFIDDGTPPANDPIHSTGGSTSPTWSYGVPGGWVVNYNGGLTLGTQGISDEVWSPEINWDMPGTADDAIDGGAYIRYIIWRHMPLANGIFYVWHVRSFPDPNTGGWTGWNDRNFVYYSPLGLYNIETQQIRDLLVPAPTKVQMALGVTDLADVFAFPGTDATPAPCFDYAVFAKYLALGPGLTTRTIDIFQDGFPTSGSLDCAGPAGDLAIRVDMARDVRASAVPAACAGDSMIMDVVARKPGAVVDTTSIKLKFVLETQNPDHFATARAAGLAQTSAVQIAPNKWFGEVLGQRSKTSAGAVVNNRWFFDLPDGATTQASYQSPENPLFFPGDEIRYFIEASTFTPAETATIPADTSGCVMGTNYNQNWTIRGLPTLTFTSPTTCTQPEIIAWNDFGWDRGGNEELLQAFNQNGLTDRVDYDTYTTFGPTSLVSNGLGGLHGANPTQMAGYSCLIYRAGDLTTTFSDGSVTGNNDKGNDSGLLTSWMSQAGNRYAAYFSDGIASGASGGSATFVSNVLNVATIGNDVRSSIGNQTAPRVNPTAAGTSLGFNTQYIAYGGCLGINTFDNINPGPGAVKAHEFLSSTGGAGVYTPAASVYWAKQDTILAQVYDRVNVTFPYGLMFVQDVTTGGSNQGGNRSARANLIRELLLKFGHTNLDVNVVAADGISSRKLTVDQNRPNPFNPSTKIAFTAPARGEVSVKIYNLRGELVTTLLNGVVDAGPNSVIWNGVDAKGQSVASGIYIYQVTGFDQTVTRKMALVK